MLLAMHASLSRLNPTEGGPFMTPVLNEIVQIMTEPRFMNKMVVVLAGYEGKIDELMAVNPGLKSRFSEKLHFPDFGSEDACKMFRTQLSKYGMDMSEEIKAHLPALMDEVRVWICLVHIQAFCRLNHTCQQC